MKDPIYLIIGAVLLAAGIGFLYTYFDAKSDSNIRSNFKGANYISSLPQGLHIAYLPMDKKKPQNTETNTEPVSLAEPQMVTFLTSQLEFEWHKKSKTDPDLRKLRVFLKDTFPNTLEPKIDSTDTVLIGQLKNLTISQLKSILGGSGLKQDRIEVDLEAPKKKR